MTGLLLKMCNHFVLAELLGILKWKDCMSDLDKNLDKLMKLQGGEIMKVWGDVSKKCLFALYSHQGVLFLTLFDHRLSFCSCVLSVSVRHS